MKRWLLIPLLLAPCLQAQTLVLSDGKEIITQGIRRAGNNIMAKVPVGTGLGEVGYPASAISQLKTAKPPQIESAGKLLQAGEPADAIVQLRPVLTAQEPFRDLPGSWWGEAAILQIDALLALEKDGEAAAYVNALKSSRKPEDESAGQVRLASRMVKKGDPVKALEIVETVIKQSSDPKTLSLAWVTKGEVLLKNRDFANAAMSFLRLPVFFPEEKSLMPQVLLGASLAMKGANDLGNAKTYFTTLITDYPNTPEAAKAKIELQKIEPPKTL